MSDLMDYVPKADDPPLKLVWHKDQFREVEHANFGPFSIHAYEFKYQICAGSWIVAEGGDVRKRSRQAAEAKLRNLLAEWTKRLDVGQVLGDID